MCTNTSLPPSTGWIKPKPLDVLKNFTVPVAMSGSSKANASSASLSRRPFAFSPSDFRVASESPGEPGSKQDRAKSGTTRISGAATGITIAVGAISLRCRCQKLATVAFDHCGRLTTIGSPSGASPSSFAEPCSAWRGPLPSPALVSRRVAYPQPLFAYHVEAGRLSLYSDVAFDPAAGRAVLDEVAGRLARSALDDRAPHRIFVANAEWRRRLLFLWGYGAGGINFYPVGGGVFLRQADIAADRLLHASCAGNPFPACGTPVAPPRTLAYYAAHEIGHDFIAERVGQVANWRLPKWIREGMVDYIGYASQVDVDALRAAWKRGDPTSIRALRHLCALSPAGRLVPRPRGLDDRPAARVGHAAGRGGTAGVGRAVRDSGRRRRRTRSIRGTHISILLWRV